MVRPAETPSDRARHTVVAEIWRGLPGALFARGASVLPFRSSVLNYEASSFSRHSSSGAKPSAFERMIVTPSAGDIASRICSA